MDTGDEQIDKLVGDLITLTVGMAARLRIVGAQVEQTMLILRDDQLAMVMAEAGRKWHDLSPADKAKFGPAHLEQGMALLDYVSAVTVPAVQPDVAAVKKYRDLVASLPADEAAMLIRQCWMTQTFDKEKARMNRIAYHFDGMHIADGG